MKKVYYLSTCNTCKRIMTELKIGDDFEKQDIKTEPITEEQLNAMREMTNSYETLFSKIARKYKEMGLKDKNLTEEDFKQLILEEYTFLKRPVFIIDDHIFIGSSKKVVAAIAQVLS